MPDKFIVPERVTREAYIDLLEQLEVTQDALNRALNILKDDGYEDDPDFGPAYREMAAALDSFPASEGEE